MQVYIDDGERTGIPVDLAECFPDRGPDYDAAIADLATKGEHVGGGGAAPTFRLVATRKIVTRHWDAELISGFRWSAKFDGRRGGPVGLGRTEQEAVCDLLGCEG